MNSGDTTLIIKVPHSNLTSIGDGSASAIILDIEGLPTPANIRVLSNTDEDDPQDDNSAIFGKTIYGISTRWISCEINLN